MRSLKSITRVRKVYNNADLDYPSDDADEDEEEEEEEQAEGAAARCAEGDEKRQQKEETAGHDQPFEIDGDEQQQKGETAWHDQPVEDVGSELEDEETAGHDKALREEGKAKPQEDQEQQQAEDTAEQTEEERLQEEQPQTGGTAKHSLRRSCSQRNLRRGRPHTAGALHSHMLRSGPLRAPLPVLRRSAPCRPLTLASIHGMLRFGCAGDRRRPAISITMHACRRMGVRVLLVPSLPWSPPDKKTPARRNRASC